MERLSITELKHLKNQAKSLTDKRIKRKCKYKIWDIVCVALLAVIANCNEWEEIEIFAEAIRSHWEVENKLHWQMDYTFKCDKNQTVNKRALFNLQIIKKFALNILNLVKEDYKRSLKKIRFQVSLGAEEEIHNIFYLIHKKKLNF